MEFEYTEIQQKLFNRISRIAHDTLNSQIVDNDRENCFSRTRWDLCAELGLCGVVIPNEYGGLGYDTLTSVIALEALGYGCRDNGLSLAIGAHLWGCLTILWKYGTEEQQQQLIPLAQGKEIIALAISEPGAGSDITHLSTTATKVDGGYKLNGHKIYVTNAPVSDQIIVLATTDVEAGTFGMTAFLLNSASPGLKLSESVEKMGMRTAAMGEIYFEDCFVPASGRIGKEGTGFMTFMKAMEWERAFILAPAVGAMQRLFESTQNYALNREQFGKPIAEFAQVNTRLVDMYRRVDMARLLLYRTASKADKNQNIMLDAALTKLTISEAWVATCQDALDIYAGYGYLTKNEVERELRDAFASQIYSGTSDIQKQTIARRLKIF